jgi:hypothetical protein
VKTGDTIFTDAGSITIPPNYIKRVANNLKGYVYQKPLSVRDADSIRVAFPSKDYPNGYVRTYNSSGSAYDYRTGIQPTNAVDFKNWVTHFNILF